VEKVNGAVILPGETFSFWKLVGKPSRRKGYLEGMNLRSGTVVPAIGGGMCQLTNLIYWMTLHTPLTVTERHRHSYDVFPDSNRTQPFGSGATCFYNYGDLMIRNDTSNAWRLVLEVTENELAGAWTCAVPSSLIYEVFEKASFIQLETWGGYTRNNILFRKVIDNANPGGDGEEYITENHALMMYAPLLDDGAK
ncbi:MAG: VanW family protein, partial [Oscillospiraceae bacterium]|nr:VanW family protein [Oscillospiraceae bacterium]